MINLTYLVYVCIYNKIICTTIDVKFLIFVIFNFIHIYRLKQKENLFSYKPNNFSPKKSVKYFDDDNI